MVNVNGFLTSQIGYDLGDPKRAILRSYRREYVPDGATYQVFPAAGFLAGLTALRDRKRFEA
jgi:hypothetical protein